MNKVLNNSRVAVIIPTRNRANVIDKCLSSLAACSKIHDADIIVVNNDSTDNTEEIVVNYKAELLNLRYIKNDNSSLHSGRHLGADSTEAEVIAFIDDDSFVRKDWISSIIDVFEDKNVLLATGPCYPRYESTPPEWLSNFWKYSEKGKWLGYLSIMDFGNEEFEIPPHFVWGCNFIIRKDILKKCNGFHPDSVPFDKIYYRGDGESSVAFKVNKLSGKIAYHPSIAIDHLVSENRLSITYFLKRAFCQGISDSYTNLRVKLLSEDYSPELPSEFYDNSTKKCSLEDMFIQNAIDSSLEFGKRFHKGMFEKYSELRDYVLAENYFGDENFAELEPVYEYTENSNDDLSLIKQQISWIWNYFSQQKKMKIALFGAGNFCKRLINMLDRTQLEAIQVIVDENQKEVDWTDIVIAAPDELKNYQIDVIILASDTYQDLFKSKCHKYYGNRYEIIDLFPKNGEKI